jgi:hypothetical protein
MNKLSLLFFTVLMGCAHVSKSGKSEPLCEFELAKLKQCTYQDYMVNIQSSAIASDEIVLTSLTVDSKGKKHVLSISADTSLLEGDRGFISFDDINFDGIADIAITTSFGLANLYLDYWVYDKATKTFVKIGNYTQFTRNADTKTLTNQVKGNAASYQKHEYYFNGFKLVRK